MALIKLNNRSSEDTAIHGRRNLIINGAMQVAQRGTQTNQTTAFTACDRFDIAVNGAAIMTTSQDTTVPSGQGFSNSLKIDVTTADSSLAASDLVLLRHKIEAQNLQHLLYGTSDAKNITLSFWVRSSKTGTYIIELRHADATYYNGQAYTINTADTWQNVTVTFDGYTATAFNNDNGLGLAIDWWLAAGSTFSGGTLSSNTWQNTEANRTAGQVNFVDNAANNFYLTGVQLEVGDTATPFEHRSFGEEISLCQRYYQSIDYYYDYGSTSSAGNVFYYTNFSFPVTMRATPAMTASQWGQNTGNATTRYTATTVNGWIMQSAIPTGCLMRGNHGNIYNGMFGRGKFDAEL
jgi:hypothetical protein